MTWRRGELSDVERRGLSDEERGASVTRSEGTCCMGNSLSSISPFAQACALERLFKVQIDGYS